MATLSDLTEAIEALETATAAQTVTAAAVQAIEDLAATECIEALTVLDAAGAVYQAQLDAARVTQGYDEARAADNANQASKRVALANLTALCAAFAQFQ
jgi:hypothetical protein